MSNDKLRQRILYEAARLLSTGQAGSCGKAKWMAARKLCRGWIHSSNLPLDCEIRDEIHRLTGVRGSGQPLPYESSGGLSSGTAAEPPDAPMSSRSGAASGTADGVDSEFVAGPTPADAAHDASAESGDEAAMRLPLHEQADRFALYRALLLPLEKVIQPRGRHPEGDALYHSLQVFALAQEELPYDEEFLLAALLHDVGKGIDPHDAVASGLAALGDSISERTAWLIEHHREAQCLLDGTIGARARRRLANYENHDELLLLARCDRAGRVCGAVVPELDEALASVRELADNLG